MAKIKFDFSKDNVKYIIKFSSILLILTFVRAIFTYMFILPNGFAPGGIAGISSIIYNLATRVNDDPIVKIVCDAGLTSFIMNIPLLFVAFKKFNSKFAFNTFFVVTLYSVFMSIFHLVDFPQYFANGDTGIMLIAAIAGGAGCGVSFGFMIKNNMCMGGTDIIGKLIYQKDPSATIHWWILICDGVVVLASGALGFIGLDLNNSTPTEILTVILSPILFSFVSLFIQTETSDSIAAGLQSSLVFNIISSHPDEIAKDIIEKVHRGVTVSNSVGYYTGKEQKMLTCVITKRQVNLVKQIIDEKDPKAFTYITKANEVNGLGFKKYTD